MRKKNVRIKRKKIKKENPKRRTEDGKKSRACFDLFKVLK